MQRHSRHSARRERSRRLRVKRAKFALKRILRHDAGTARLNRPPTATERALLGQGRGPRPAPVERRRRDVRGSLIAERPYGHHSCGRAMTWMTGRRPARSHCALPGAARSIGIRDVDHFKHLKRPLRPRGRRRPLRGAIPASRLHRRLTVGPIERFMTEDHGGSTVCSAQARRRRLDRRADILALPA